jgi:hypothetical protein
MKQTIDYTPWFYDHETNEYIKLPVRKPSNNNNKLNTNTKKVEVSND